MAEPDEALGTDPTIGPPAATAKRVAEPVSGVEHTVAAPISGAPSVAGAPGDDLDALAVVDDGYYVRGDEIARGGMGRIVEARDRRLGRVIALKELIDRDAGLAARFEREARITARLQHPAIVAIYEAGRWSNGEAFYAMKRVTGTSFDKVLDKARTLQARLALLPNMLAVADALAYAHGEGIVHRDLKPANVLIGGHGETVVIDWGLAKELRTDGSPEPISDGGSSSRAVLPGQTVSGAVMGTPAYMPPEQARGNSVDQRADVYALGAMLYHVLAGRQPYGSSSADATLKAVLAGPPRPLRDVVPEVPEDLEAIVDKAMAPVADHRYPTATGLAEDLRRYQTGQLVAAHAYSPKELIYRWLRRHKAAVSVGLVMLLLSAIALVIAFRSVVAARDRATAERELAQARADELVLRRARDLLGSDPTAALAWLAQYPAAGPERDEAALIAAEASSLGIARHVLAGHTRDVRDVAISPDAAWIASAGADGDVRLWNAATGQTRVLLGGTTRGEEGDKPEHPAALRLAFAPSGKFLAATTVDGKLHVWESTSWSARPDLVAGKAAIRALGWSPDGRWLVAAGDDRALRVWSIPDFKPALSIDVGDDLFELAFTHDSTLVAAAGRMHEVRAWELPAGKQHVFGPIGDGTLNVRFSVDGARIAAASRDGKTYVWAVATGELIRSLDDARLVRSIAFSPSGTQIATAGEGPAINVWTLATGDRRTFAGHRDAVVDVAFTRDGSQLISASLDHTLAIWDVASGSRRVLEGHHDMVNRFALAADDSLIASAGKDHVVRVWPLRRESSPMLAVPGQTAADVAFAPRGKPGQATTELATAWRDGRIIAWTPGQAVDEAVLSPACKSGAPRRIAYSPDGARIAWVGGERDAHICEHGVMRTLVGNASETFTLAFTPDGHLVTGGIDKTVRIWNGDVPTTLYTHQGGVWTVAISPDGKRFASAGFDKQVAIGWLDGGSPVRTHAGHRDAINAVAFSRDGKLVASVSDDETARVWSVDSDDVIVYDLQRTSSALDVLPSGAIVTGTHDGSVRLWSRGSSPPRVLARHHGAVASIAVSPDGHFVASGGQDGTVWLADMQRGGARVFVTDGAVRRVMFSPDGKRLASAGSTVRVWDVDGLPIELAKTTAVVRDDGEIATP